ncbi:MAG: hypothetical protein AWM53_00105 [Candidatus Dichloromethanomonas elyunquensis]|nr:MAG: hypothetical protein AWM53_00105 [Candidatus Dichloromethanomonas elyunquensis]
MFGKIFRYYEGRIYIKALGSSLSEFMNQALKEGIVFYNGRRLKDSFVAEINTKDFRPLRRIAKENKVKLKIRAKYGFPFVALRWQRRKGLIIGLFLIFAALAILSQFVLSVSVEGNERIDSGRIITEAQKAGLNRWVLKSGLHLDQMSKQLQESIPDLAWVTMEERGTNIRIRVVEKKLPQKVEFTGDLIAGKTGFVDNVIVIQGIPVVKEGQTVKKGQVLIKASGGMTEYSFDMAAKGFVRGRVWYSSEKKVPLTEDITEKTGKVAHGWGIKIKDRVIMITNQKSPYSESFQETKSYALPAWRNWRFPVEIIKVQYEETQKVHVERTVSAAKELAETLAREELKGKIPPEAKVLQDKVRVLSSEKGVEFIRVEIETFEELAVYKQ